MRRLFAVLVTCVCVLVPGLASATIYYVSGTVGFVMSQDSGFGTNSDWFTLSGVGAQGGCGPGGVGSNMAIAMKDDQYGSRQYSMVLAAWIANTTLTVRVDDSYKNAAGVCYAEYIW